MELLHDRFRILDLVNEGGQGRIYVVKELKSNEMKALKLYQYRPSPLAYPYNPEELESKGWRIPNGLREFLIWASPDQRMERFLKRQVLLQSKLDHPSILQAQELILEKPYCQILPLVRGGSLRSMSRKKKGLTFHQTGVYLAQLVQILDHCHQRGVIHRDIKPDNVLIGESQKVILTDFDFAHFPVNGWKEMFLTRYYRYKGTAYYMSPEHLRGAFPHPGMDQYSLATTLYEIMSLELPFGKDLRSREDLSNYKPLPFLNKKQNEALKVALEPKPKNRYSNIVQLYTNLYSH